MHWRMISLSKSERKCFFWGIRSHSEIFSGRKVFRMRKLIYGNHSSLLQDHHYYESNVVWRKIKRTTEQVFNASCSLKKHVKITWFVVLLFCYLILKSTRRKISTKVLTIFKGFAPENFFMSYITYSTFVIISSLCKKHQ